jgi:tetratricopeptide (TPR) repeat protein
MTRFINLSVRIVCWYACLSPGVLLGPTVASCQLSRSLFTLASVTQSSNNGQFREALQDFKEASLHLQTGRRYIQEALDGADAIKVHEAHLEFEAAAEAFRRYANEPVSESDRLKQLSWAAGGLLECNHPVEALELILKHPGMAADPTLLHLKADALLALGERRLAASAYEEWITQGRCGGYQLAYASPPLRGDPLIRLAPKEAPRDPCAMLPRELRARLEAFQVRYGHPKNLPPRNYPLTPEDE